jgi:hypothetical protein
MTSVCTIRLGMSSHLGPRDRTMRVLALVRTGVVVALAATVIAIVLLAPADAATPTSAHVGLALTRARAAEPAAIGDRRAPQERGLAWASGRPRGTVEAGVASLAVVVLAIHVATVVRRRAPRRLDPPRARWAGGSAATRGPPASFARS